jgi:predicted glutamine amidotransferase
MTTQPPPGVAGRSTRRRARVLISLAAALGVGLLLSRTGPDAGEGARAWAPEHACRFWGIVGTGYDEALIPNQLRDDPTRSFKRLGSANPDGWGFAVFPGDTLRSTWPLLRRGRPSPSNPYAPGYDLALAELGALWPRAVLAHVRLDDIRHLGVPDPHPFLHEGIAFIHSGNIRDVTALEDTYLTPSYLTQHPPDYAVPKMDAELLFLYLLKLMNESPDMIEEAIHTAVVQLAPVTEDDRLDCVFTRGDTLYALRYAGADTTEPLMYYPSVPGGDAVSPFWVVATQIVGSEINAWAAIPPRTLAVFLPGEPVRLVPVGPGRTDAGARGGSTGQPPDGGAPTVPLKARFWALVGSGYPASLWDEHLRGPQGLEAYGEAGTLGWGMAAFVDAVAPERLQSPLFYRGGPSAADPYDPDFDRAAGEIASVRPRAAIGHVRAASSGHPDVPDPHPFQHDGFVFVHNGSLNATPLFEFLQNTEPRDFLETHPPEYVSGHIDSELYMLYLLKYMQVYPEPVRAEALRLAVRSLSGEMGGSRLNFLMTAGDTLYALRYNDAQGVVFGPGDLVMASPYWVVASESVGRGMPWHTIPERCLAAFVPGQAPVLYPIEAGQEPDFEFATISIRKLQDQDGDGWSPHIQVGCDPNVDWGAVPVSLRLLAREQGGDWRLLLDTEPQIIIGDGVDTSFCPDFWVEPDTLPPARWDLWLQLLSSQYPGRVLTEATGQTHPGSGLSGLAVEGAARDTTNDLAPCLHVVSVAVQDEVDLDEDGHARSFRIQWETTLEHADSLDVYAKLYWSDGVHVPSYLRGETYGVQAGLPTPGSLELVVRPPNLAPVTWECYLELFDAAEDTLAIRVTADDFAALRGIRVEGEAHDDPEPPPSIWIGAAQPNPGSGVIDVPIGIPAGGASLKLEVFDAQGRFVRTFGPTQGEAGVTALTWDGRDRGDRAVPAGIYYLDVQVGGQRKLLRCVIVRSGRP